MFDLLSGNTTCSNVDKMDETKPPEGFIPDFQPKYDFILLVILNMVVLNNVKTTRIYHLLIRIVSLSRATLNMYSWPNDYRLYTYSVMCNIHFVLIIMTVAKLISI